ncbi:MAG: hypothetical protein AAGU32_22940, partial [Bacillota bacterium]
VDFSNRNNHFLRRNRCSPFYKKDLTRLPTIQYDLTVSFSQKEIGHIRAKLHTHQRLSLFFI